MIRDKYTLEELRELGQRVGSCYNLVVHGVKYDHYHYYDDSSRFQHVKKYASLVYVPEQEVMIVAAMELLLEQLPLFLDHGTEDVQTIIKFRLEHGI